MAAARAERPDLLLREPDAVDDGDMLIDDAERVEVRKRRLAVFLLHLLDLKALLGDMDMKRRAVLHGQRMSRLDHLRRRGMQAVRCGDDLRHAALVALHEHLRIRLGERELFHIAGGRARPIVHRAGEHEPDAEIACGPDDCLIALHTIVVQVKEITDGRRAALHHLREGEKRARVNILRPQARRILIKRFIAPGEERLVRRDAAEQALKTVIVRIDRPRHEREMLPPLRRGLRMRAPKLRGRTDSRDGAIRDENRQIALRPSLREAELRLDEPFLFRHLCQPPIQKQHGLEHRLRGDGNRMIRSRLLRAMAIAVHG